MVLDENIIYDNTHKNITRQNLKDIFLFQTQGVHISLLIYYYLKQRQNVKT